MDTDVTGFGLRVSPKSKRTFILVNRFGGRYPTARSLGAYPDISLSEARDKAREWRKLIANGIDPKVEKEQRQREQRRQTANTFVTVAEDFLTHISGQRRADDAARTMRRAFIPRWGNRPIATIERSDIRQAIEDTVKRGKRSMAHVEFALLRRLFNFALARDIIDRSPCDRMRPTDFIGETRHRDRILADNELRALWKACDELGYPFGSMVKLLLLTGTRRSEAAEARWSEFDLGKAVWTIPQHRAKSAAPHVIPLTPDILALLDTLPRLGDCVFSYSYGATPMAVSAPLKRSLDAAMSKHLGRSMPAWVLHDARRTVRSNLPRLRVPTEISELVIGHSKRGLQKIYDQYAYFDEKREALQLWNDYLRGILR
jgi:integrase